MTPGRFAVCLGILRLSQRALAPIIGCAERLPRDWAAGTRTIPPLIAEWVEACVKLRKQHPDPRVPPNWRRLGRGPAKEKSALPRLRGRPPDTPTKKQQVAKAVALAKLVKRKKHKNPRKKKEKTT